MLARDENSRQALGEKTLQKLKHCKVLLVGAGGIGCELLKNIVLLGIGEIHVIDLDTIDLSNLNRQFLFGREHIKKPKALVAKETASKFNPNVNIVAYQANITDKEFNVKWFKSFDIVYNALDNVEARRHVNRLCLVADVPLIESGTSGFDGQVQVIIPGKTECYDCQPKPVTKTFPVCTIRSTPSQPIHCIVWAKSYLFSQLFDHEADDDEDDDDDTGSRNSPISGGDGATTKEEQDELVKLKRERNELKSLKQSILEDGFAQKMFDKVFGIDIQRLLSMESMWKSRKPPVPLKYTDLNNELGSIDESVLKNDQKVLSLEENFYVLNHSLARLQQRIRQQKVDNPSAVASLSFDKDDIDTLDFVAAAANIRSAIFAIPTKSGFDIKQIAGNIIPAIATTNAIIAGICVLQSLLVLNDKIDSARNVSISRLPNCVVQAIKLDPPNPECVVSGVARTVVKADPSKLTLGTLIDSLLKLDLGYTEELSVVTNELLYDPDFDDNLERTLADLKIVDGSFITIIDEQDDGKVNLELYIEASINNGNGDITDTDAVPYVLPTRPVIPLKPKSTVAVNHNGEVDGILDIDVESSHSSNNKRKLDLENNDTVTKKVRISNEEDDDVILIDDEDDPIEILDDD